MLISLEATCNSSPVSLHSQLPEDSEDTEELVNLTVPLEQGPPAPISQHCTGCPKSNVHFFIATLSYRIITGAIKPTSIISINQLNNGVGYNR